MRAQSQGIPGSSTLRNSGSSGRSRQRGLSMFGWLLVIIVVGSAATMVLRIVPHYIDHETMISVIESLPRDRVNRMSPAEIRELLTKRLKINNIRDLDLRQIIKIDQKRDGTTLKLGYERREHLFYNIDIVLTFQDSFDFPG